MTSIDKLIDRLNNKGVKTEPHHIQHLRNIGYYSGYKKYSFIRKENEPIQFSNFDDVINLNKFDMELKNLFYPKIMFIERAFKNYILECILENSKNENSKSLFDNHIINHNLYTPKSRNYEIHQNKIIYLKKIVNDYINDNIPIYKVINKLTLGNFYVLVSCLDKKIKQTVSKLLNIPSNFDNDGTFIEYSLCAIKDLRNAVSHNDVVFDTRFKNSKINHRVKKILQHEIGNVYIFDFSYIHEYVSLIVYILSKLNQNKEELIQFLNNFTNSINIIKNFTQNTRDKILSTNINLSMENLKQFIEKV